MSEKEIVKEGMEQAEKSLREKQVEEVKKIALKTLEKLDSFEKDKKALEAKIKVLRLDIDDLKDGRLDRIAERQEKDEDAKKVSVVIIIKEKEVIREVAPWHWPYVIHWRPQSIPTFPGSPVWCGGTLDCTVENVTAVNAVSGQSTDFIGTCSNYTGDVSINGAIAKDATIGAYEVHGHMVHLR